MSDISDVSLSAIVNKDTFFIEVNAQCAVFFQNFFNQKIVALRRTVPPECLGLTHFVDSHMHCLNYFVRQRTSDIANTESDNFNAGM